MASRSMKNRPGAKKKHPKIGLLVVFSVFAAVVVAGAAGMYALGATWLGDDLPDYENADAFNTAQPTEVWDSSKTVLLAKFQLENRDPIALDQMGTYVLQGTVDTEDERFYDHGGFDVYGIVRAAIVTLTGSGREGASTITQQFVRNTILSDEMNDISFKRKVREMYLSVKLEEQYSKDEILRMYLNTINYGSGAYGIQAAAQRYFSKDAADLTLVEAATLIGIPQSPTYNNPIDNPDNCLARRNLVLDRMLTAGHITQEEHDAAQAEPLVLNPTLPSTDGLLAYPHFTNYVKQTLLDTYSIDEILKGGFTVITTLDLSAQETAEAAVAAKEEGLNAAIQGSLVALDPETGHVKALVGGKDYSVSQVNLATGWGTDEDRPGRPCGSAFKVFTLIAALEEGINPQTMVDCSSPATIPNTTYSSSNPLQNIDNHNYGTRTIQRAFAVSSNTGFVRLEMAVGVDKVIETAQKMGISSPLTSGAALTLGQDNVTMIDMAQAYAAIANGGTLYKAQPILQVYDSDGNLKEDNSAPEGERVISPEVAHAATEVMKSVVSTSEGTGTSAALSSGQEVAAKTGTSSSYNDITFCGITPQMAVTIWFGDPSNAVQIPTSVTAGDVFRNFMTEVLDGQPLQSFPSAADPTYQSSYSNSTYRIGGTSSGSSSSSSGDSSGSGSSSSNGSGSNSSSGSGSGSSGGSTGDSTGGGSGNNGGSTGGGSTGGGSTGGGDDGGDDGGNTGGGSGTGGDTGGGSGGNTGGGGGGTTTPSSAVSFQGMLWSKTLSLFAS